jgi:hypothetical protein
MVWGVAYLKERLGETPLTYVYILVAGVAAGATLGIFGDIMVKSRDGKGFNNTAFEFDVERNAGAGLYLTVAAVVLTVFDFYLWEKNKSFCVTPITIACGSLAVFAGISLYIALPGNTHVMWLVVSQAVAVGVQLGAIANADRIYSSAGGERDVGMDVMLGGAHRVSFL